MKIPIERTRFAVLSLMLLLILSSCDLNVGDPYTESNNPTPVATVQQLSYPQQPPRIYEVWLLNTSAFLRSSFHEAAQAFSSAFEQAIQPGYVGAVVNVSLITGNSYDPANTIMSFTIPPTPLYPQLVHHHSDDPYIDAQLAKEDAKIYQQEVQALQQALEHVRAQIREYTTRLSSIDPPVDTSGKTDLWGSLNRASQRLQGGRNPKYYLIAGMLENTAWQQFIPGDALWGTKVRVYFNYCVDAPSCKQSTDFWIGVYNHARATDVRVFDPAQSQTLAITNRLLA